MSKATTLNIYDFLTKEHYRYICPNIQRDFVWKERQITQLFDSINKKMFIGYLLFWEPQDNFLLKEIGYFPLPEKIEDDRCKYPRNQRYRKLIGVLDGQQRLASLIIGTWGEWNGKKLCFNGEKFKFQKWPLKHSSKSRVTWIPVEEIMRTKGRDLPAKQQNFKKIIEKYEIPFYTLNHNDTEVVLQIFRRINKAGTPLSNTQELLSNIAPNWPEGRNKFKKLVEDVSKNDLSISYDFIVKSYLFCEGESLKISKRKKENPIEGMKDEERWDKLSEAICQTAALVKSLNFTDSTIISYNALIPIVYYYNKKCKPSRSDIGNIQKYLYISFFKGIFGKSSDAQLTRIRGKIDKNGIEEVLKSKDFRFDEEDIDNVLNFKKGRLTKTALQFLYEISSKNMDDDHMHPRAIISNPDKFKAAIKDEKNDKLNHEFFSKKENKGIEKKLSKNWEKIADDCDKLPNLQPLSRKLNKIKLTASLIEWEEASINKLRFVNKNTSRLLSNFEEFFKGRRNKMRKKLMELINK